MTRIATGLLCMLSFLSACSDNRMASDRAAEGAAGGAVAGAVGGAVWALVWGGDAGQIAERAAAGAAVGAAVGGTSGAISGAAADDELRRELGPDNYRAIFSLVDCNHRDALDHIAHAEQSDDDQYRLAAVWLQATVATELGEEMQPFYIRVMQADRDTGTEAEVKAGIKSVLHEVENERARLGRRRKCQ